MAMRQLSLVVFLVLCAMCVVDAVWYYPQLPERVASHFGPSGQPDAWSTKKVFVTFYLVTTAFCAFLLLGVSLLIYRIPESLIKFPNKDYWLSPERKKKTFDFMFQYFLWFASATVLLLLDMFQQSIQVHLGKTDSLSHPILSLGLYAGFTVVWSIGLIVFFRKKS